MSENPAVLEIRNLRATLVPQVSVRVELPEADAVLDMESRRGSEVRQYKHIVQSCSLHIENYLQATRVKHMYLLDAFLSGADQENPMALYAVARSMFELSAFLHEVGRRLVETSEAVNDQNWLPLGEKFFALIVRARYATAHPEYRALLLAAGVPSARLKPFNITECVSRLTETEAHSDAVERYALLCDFVHHNLSAATTATSGVRVGDTAFTGAGRIVTDRPGTICRYEYPIVGKFQRELANVAPGFLQDARACLEWAGSMPHMPFSQELNQRMTGFPLGAFAVPGRDAHE